MRRSHRQRLRNRPFGVLARFYDQVVAGVPAMNRHARDQVLSKVLPRARMVCDLACGSGEAALDLARAGLSVQALDLSPTFCRIVRDKARRAGLKIRVERADMRSFALREPVDLVTCEFAALNNLDRREDLGRVLRRVARALRPGGWFYFDVNTPLAHATQCAPAQWEERPDFKLVTRCSLEDAGRRIRLDLEWFLPARGRYRHVRETIVNVCWTEAEIRRALKRAGFGSVRVFDGADVRPASMGTRRGTDLYFLARRARSSPRRAGS